MRRSLRRSVKSGKDTEGTCSLNGISGREGALGVQKLNSATALIQRHQGGSSMQSMYYVGLDVHKKTISYCVKDVRGTIHSEVCPCTTAKFAWLLLRAAQ